MELLKCTVSSLLGDKTGQMKVISKEDRKSVV